MAQVPTPYAPQSSESPTPIDIRPGNVSQFVNPNRDVVAERETRRLERAIHHAP